MTNNKSKHARVIKHFGHRTSSSLVPSQLDRGSASPEPQTGQAENMEPTLKKRQLPWASHRVRTRGKPLNLAEDLAVICDELPPELKIAEEFHRALERVGRNPVVILEGLDHDQLQQKVWFALHGDRPMPDSVARHFV